NKLFSYELMRRTDSEAGGADAAPVADVFELPPKFGAFAAYTAPALATVMPASRGGEPGLVIKMKIESSVLGTHLTWQTMQFRTSLSGIHTGAGPSSSSSTPIVLCITLKIPFRGIYDVLCGMRTYPPGDAGVADRLLEGLEPGLLLCNAEPIHLELVT